MKIPTVEQSVGFQATPVKEIKAPTAVPDAFGANVAQEKQKLGAQIQNTGMLLENHIQEQNYWNGQANIANKSLELKNSFQDMATSTEPITDVEVGRVSPGGLEASTTQDSLVGQPKGYMNRLGFSAKGSTEDFIKQSKPIVDEYLEQFKSNPRLYREAARNFNQIYSSYYDQVSQHEAAQWRVGMNNTFNASTVNTMASTAAATDPASLMAGIDLIKNATTQQYQFKGSDQEEIDMRISNNVANAVSKAVTNKLSSTADLEQARAMLNTAKDMIPADRYEKIDSMLDTGFEKMQKQAHTASVQKQINGQASLLSGLAEGKTNWMNIDDVTLLAQKGVVSQKFAKAYVDVIEAKGNYRPREESNENVPKFIDAIYRAPDQTKLHDTLIDMLQEHKNMSQDEMAILINSAIKRSGSLPLDVKQSGKYNPDPKQLNIDAGARAVVNFGKRNNLSNDEISFMYANYYNSASKGTAVNEAINQATNQYAIAKYPVVATMDGTPHAVVSPNSGIKYLHFSSDKTVYPERIWNPKTGVFDVNTNRAKSAGGKKPEEK